MNSLCSHERLELALAGSLNADDEATLHLHLEECELCFAEMERLSGGEQASREIAAMLIPDDFYNTAPLREECSTADFVVDHLEPSDDPAVLGRLGGYDVLDIIGRGGMGVVLKGFDRELKRFVAIKALAPHLAHSALARKRFAREAQAAAAVVNLHVIAIHQVQPNGQLPFLVMPLLAGESLAQRLKARGTLELKEILRIGMQAAEGLAAAHGQGLIHRDVKPANILLEKGVERAVLTDFGLARAADDVSMTRQGIIAGTPEYMSPEQARGEALDGRSDLFSLGCVLYEMATGVSPFRTDSTMATLRRIVDEQPVAMASFVPELPPWFCHIVERLLSKDPAQRFASASEVGQLLEQCLSHLQQPTSVPLPASLVPHAKKSAQGRRSFFISTRKGIFAMLGTIGMTLLGLVLLQATEPPDISGHWTSEDWGTVVLEAKEPGEYEGTFTGSGKDKLAASNDPPGGSPSTEPGITLPLLGPGWIQVKDTTLESPVGLPAGAVKLREDGLVIADLNGDGQPEFFRADPNGPAPVALNFQDKASDVTNGVDTGTTERSTLAASSAVRPRASGTLHLKWSRLERRFNGTWGKGSDRSGTMSLRLVDQEIRGGWTTDEDAQLASGTPLLGDLSWKRSVVTVPDGGNVLLGGPKSTSEAAKRLDRQNARAVVEAFVAAILAGDHETAQSLARVPAVDISALANGLNVKRLAIKTVHVGSDEEPKDANAFAATAEALATSEAVHLEGRLRPSNHGQRDGFLMFRLNMGEAGWSVNNIIFESEEGADRELKAFLDANPKSIGSSKPGRVSSTPAAPMQQQAETFDPPPSPAATPDSKAGANAPAKPSESGTPKLPKLPDDAYARPGVHCQSFSEEDAKRRGGELMGAVLEPSKPDERNKEPLVLGVRTASDAQWRIGGTARVGLVVRNRTDGIERDRPGSDVKFSYTRRLDNGLSVVAVDEAGKEYGATIAHFRGELGFQHMLLPVAHVATIKEFTIRFDAEKRDVSNPFVAAFYLPPGKYKLRCKWNDARPDVAHEGEWTGELVNEELEFTLAAAVADPPPTSEAPKATEKEPFTAWGEEVNGVQIGARLGEQRIYEVVESATLILRLRNNGKVQVPYRYGDEYFLKNPPLITDASGKAVTIKAMSVFGKVLSKSVAPGKEVDLVQLKLDLRPATDRSKDAAWTIYGTGKFQIQYPVAGVVGEVGPDLPGMKLTTGKLELEVKEPFTAWGKEVGGLQAGLGFKAGEKRAYSHGETVDLVLRVRNVGKEMIKFSYFRDEFYENPPIATDGVGKSVHIEGAGLDGEPNRIELNLAPGKEFDLSEINLGLRPASEKGKQKPAWKLFGTGKFQLQCERVAGSFEDRVNGGPDPILSKLATGKLELEIKPVAPQPAAEAPNAKLQPATETPGADIVKFPDAEYAKDGFPLDDLNGEGVMWNGEESGLSLGYRIAGDEWRILGKELKVELWVRNAGKEDVKFQILGRTDEGLRVKLTGNDGREHFASMVPNDVPLFGMKHLLSPGQCIKVNDFSVGLLPPEQKARIGNELRFFVSPGWYQLVCEVKVPGFTATGGDRKQTVPGAGEWTGTITTRSLNVEVVAPDAPPPKPRIEHADVDLEKDGTLYLNRNKVTLDELDAIAAKDAKKRFTIRADKDVPYAKVIEVVEALKAAGVTEFSFSEARVGDGKYRVANRTGTYEFDDKHGFSICRPSERPQWFTVSWPAEGDRPTCALRTFPNVSDKTYGKWAVVWEPGTDVLWWVDDSEVGKMTLTDPTRVIVDREGRTNSFSRDFGLPEEVKTEFRRLGFVIGREKMPELEKVAENNTGGNSGGQTIVSAEFGWWCIEGTVTDADGKPLANVPVRVSTNQEIKTEKTDAKGSYRVNFSLPLKLLAHSRAVTVQSVLEGFTERDMAKSGKFNVLLRAGEEPQRVRLADDKDFQPGPIPRFAERDLLPSQHGASPGKPGRADFVMIKAGEITSEIVPADGSGKAPVKVEAVAPSEGGAALKPDANAAVRVVEGAAPELRKSPPYNFRDSDQYRALDESSRSRLKTVVDDLAQLERALDSFMKDHDGTQGRH